MRIGPPDDDVKVRRQNRPTKAKGTETRPVDELIEIARMPPIESNHEHNVQVRAEEQRLLERRKENRKTTLDTRGPHDRRISTRRKEEIKLQSEGQSDTSPRGIDILI